MCTSARSMIENLNYANDRRHRQEAAPTLERDDGTVVTLPTRWEVCGTCNGEGKHVNPSIDSNGLTHEDFASDPEFAEAYFDGTYDVTCATCHGRTTERVVDLDAMSADLRAEYEAHLKADREYEMVCAYERRMGC